MKLAKFTAPVITMFMLAACLQASVETAANESAAQTVEKVEVLGEKTAASDYDFSAIPAGKYTSEKTHAYITFQYWHQDYSRPTIRWNDFDADVDLSTDNPAASTLMVTINAASIDSGVAKFDAHLKGADMFDVDKYPTITFKSTKLDLNAGTLTGDLTIKGTTKSIVLDASLNKVGESRKGVPMFGVSAKTAMKRSDWDVGYAVPVVGDDVEIMIEVEFQKAD